MREPWNVISSSRKSVVVIVIQATRLTATWSVMRFYWSVSRNACFPVDFCMPRWAMCAFQ